MPIEAFDAIAIFVLMFVCSAICYTWGFIEGKREQDR